MESSKRRGSSSPRFVPSLPTASFSSNIFPFLYPREAAQAGSGEIFISLFRPTSSNSSEDMYRRSAFRRSVVKMKEQLLFQVNSIDPSLPGFFDPER